MIKANEAPEMTEQECVAAGGHTWQATPSRAIEQCPRCRIIRHTAFVGRDGQARTHTTTRTTTS